MGDTQPPEGSLVRRIFFSPEDERLRVGWRLVGQQLLFVPFALIAAFVVFPVLTDGTFSTLGESLVRLLATTIPLYLARRFFDRRSFVSLGLGWDKTAGYDLIIGFCIAGVSVSLLFLTYWSLGWLTVDRAAWQTQDVSVLLPPILLAVVVFLLSGWAEELLARGYWLQNLAEGLSSFWAVMLSSALFALSHFMNPGFTWLPFLGLFVGSFDLAFGYLRTRRLWLPVGLHAGWNFFEGTIYGFQVSGLRDFPRVLSQTVSGPDLWTGGAFGPEAGLLMIPAVAVNIGLIYFWTRNRSALQTASDS